MAGFIGPERVVERILVELAFDQLSGGVEDDAVPEVGVRLDPDGGAWRRRDNGLFQLALGIDAQKRTEWQEASKSQALAAQRGQDLLSGLGFTVERLDNLTLLHRGKVRRSALAVLVDPSELPEAGVPRFNNLPPISYALAKADSEGLPWVVMISKDSRWPFFA